MSEATAPAVQTDRATADVHFQPRASNLAYAAIQAARLTVAEERIARGYADRARFAHAGDVRRWKVRPGEVFCYVKAATVAGDVGRARQTVHNLTVALKRQGLIEVRQCDRTRRSIVFVLPARLPSAQPWKAAGNAIGKAVPEPRGEPPQTKYSVPAEARRAPGQAGDGSAERTCRDDGGRTRTCITPAA